MRGHHLDPYGVRVTTTATTTAGRAHVRAGGILYLLTFVASIPALVLLGPVLNEPGFVLGTGSDTSVLWGGLLDFVTALACAGTAVAVFPVIRRHGEALALGFVATRLIEATLITTGVVTVLGVVTLRHDAAGDPATLTVVGQALVAVHDWTFLFGPGMMPCLNALMFATLLLRARLVPRIIPLAGLAGAPLLLASSLATLFGVHEQTSGTALLAALPIAAWELAIGVWMIAKGFRQS